MKLSAKLKSSIIIWVGLYPTIHLVSFVLSSSLGSLHFLITSLIETLIIVPLMVYIVIPITEKALSRWIK